MAWSLNRWEGIGNLGKDPEVKEFDSGKLAFFNIACTNTWTDQGGQKHEETLWMKCNAWRGLAETVAKYLHQGDKVYVAGRLKTNKYTDREGVERTSIECDLTDMGMLITKRNGDAEQAPAQQAPAQRPPAQRAARAPAAPAAYTSSDVADDLPF